MTDDPQTTPPVAINLRSALRWIEEHGNLVGYPCPDSIVPDLLAAMRDGHYINRKDNTTTGFCLTAEGVSYLYDTTALYLGNSADVAAPGLA